MTAQEALKKIRDNDNNLPYVSEVEHEIHEKIFNSLNSNKNQLVIGQCGLGKTKHIIDWLALQQDKKILVCLPRYNMIDQYADALDKLNIPYERAIKKEYSQESIKRMSYGLPPIDRFNDKIIKHLSSSKEDSNKIYLITHESLKIYLLRFWINVIKL